jgi:hypothetical protein
MKYANTACPYCAVAFDPLPKAKSKCRACGRPVFVRTGPDGLRYLLQEVDLPAMEQAWAEFRVQQKATGALAAQLEQYRRQGTRVEILPHDDACVECRRFLGQIFDPRAVPALPYDRCRNAFCRCDYLPAFDQGRR